MHLYHPDIVVTDQMMPEMDGLEMLQSIRKDFQISHIPVIILTAKNDEGAKTKAITLGGECIYNQAIQQRVSVGTNRSVAWRTETVPRTYPPADGEPDDNGRRQLRTISGKERCAVS